MGANKDAEREKVKVSQWDAWIGYGGKEAVLGNENFQGVTEDVGDGHGEEKVRSSQHVGNTAHEN